MFFGTTPQIVAQFIKKEIERIKPNRVFVPFAGNFVIEQITGIVDKNIEVHSTDVMLYSRAIGHALTDTNDVKSPFELIYSYQYKHTGVYCIYSNTNTVKWVGSWSPIKEQIPKYQLIDKNDVITENSDVLFLPVSSKIANHYRLLWVKKAAMTDSGHAFLIFIDGKMAGVAVIADSLKFGTEWAVIYSDPACPHSRYKRLSKLVLYLICTKQTLKLINDKSIWEHTGFTTRVFTNEPVSMKYRSLFNLTERAEDLEGNYKHKLIYKSKKIFDSYKEALKEWLKKDGKVLE